MIRILALLFAVLAAPALAQDVFPALHDVTGVAADDVLNVRAEPGGDAPVLGTFAPDATGVEVVALSDDGAWGRVNTAEQSGWAAMTYLARQPGQFSDDWAAGLAPVGLDCFGTEPFWTLSLATDGALGFSAPDFSAPDAGDGGAQPGGYETLQASTGTGKRGFTGWLNDNSLGFIGIITHAACSDGMSDRLFGLGLDLVTETPTDVKLDAGCCRLVR